MDTTKATPDQATNQIIIDMLNAKIAKLQAAIDRVLADVNTA